MKTFPVWLTSEEKADYNSLQEIAKELQGVEIISEKNEPYVFSIVLKREPGIEDYDYLDSHYKGSFAVDFTAFESPRHAEAAYKFPLAGEEA